MNWGKLLHKTATVRRALWDVVLRVVKASPRLACLMMVAVKLSREVNLPKRDNRVDGAGYFECADLCAQREAKLKGVP